VDIINVTMTRFIFVFRGCQTKFLQALWKE
jgi:hypothetical protein